MFGYFRKSVVFIQTLPTKHIWAINGSNFYKLK